MNELLEARNLLDKIEERHRERKYNNSQPTTNAGQILEQINDDVVLDVVAKLKAALPRREDYWVRQWHALRHIENMMVEHEDRLWPDGTAHSHDIYDAQAAIGFLQSCVHERAVTQIRQRIIVADHPTDDTMLIFHDPITHKEMLWAGDVDDMDEKVRANRRDMLIEDILNPDL